MRAALVASCLRGALPPVLLRAVCFVRAIARPITTSAGTRMAPPARSALLRRTALPCPPPSFPLANAREPVPAREQARRSPGCWLVPIFARSRCSRLGKRYTKATPIPPCSTAGCAFLLPFRQQFNRRCSSFHRVGTAQSVRCHHSCRPRTPRRASHYSGSHTPPTVNQLPLSEAETKIYTTVEKRPHIKQT